MAKGRKPKPIAEHRTQGTFRKGRHGRSVANRDIPLIPECPNWLSARAKTVWADVSQLLAARNIVTEADNVALQLLCEAYADWKSLRQEIAAEGSTYETTTASGDKMRRPNPKVSMRDNAEKLLRNSLADFGLNPSARSRLNIGEPTRAENKFAKMDRENEEERLRFEAEEAANGDSFLN